MRHPFKVKDRVLTDDGRIGTIKSICDRYAIVWVEFNDNRRRGPVGYYPKQLIKIPQDLKHEHYTISFAPGFDSIAITLFDTSNKLTISYNLNRILLLYAREPNILIEQSIHKLFDHYAYSLKERLHQKFNSGIMSAIKEVMKIEH